MGSMMGFSLERSRRSDEEYTKMPHVKASRICFGIILNLVLSLNLWSIGVPNVHIDQLVATSDVIVVGEVSNVRTTGLERKMEFHGQVLQAAAYCGDVLIHRAIKGSPPERLTVTYVLPLSFIGYRGLHTGARMVFLRRAQGQYELADPYYSDFPAILSHSSLADVSDYTTEVVREMLSVIASPTSSPAEKSEVLRIDYALPSNNDVVQAFRVGVSNAQDADLRQRLQGELISFGDIVELPSVVNLLLDDAATADQRIWLLYVVGNRVKDASAIAQLRKLFHSRDASLRRAAVRALWNIVNSAALLDLVTALHDPDEDVRFYAVRAFSEIANETGWGGPSETQFQEHEKDYLQHWASWAKDHAN